MSQRLILPFKSTTLISASYKNLEYFKMWGYTHYGLDCGSSENGYNVYACGNGTVISAGDNNGGINKGIGNCVVITYANVECNNGEIRDLSCRMFHFDKIFVKNGQIVTAKTLIGEYGNSGGYYNPAVNSGKHLHIEFGTNYEHPTQSIGIARQSEGKVIKRTNIDISIDPSIVWFINDSQKIKGVTNNWFSKKDIDIPSINKTIKKDKIDSQKLILPVNNMLITASYKNKKYETLKGNTASGFMGIHYGMDFCNDLQLWASGNGVVLKIGSDSCFGNFVVIKYDNVFNHKTMKYVDVVFRYFHLASISVKINDVVNKDTKIGVMGRTGRYASGIHCHLEVDTDCKNWEYTPTLSGNTSHFKSGLKGVNDTTFNPLEVLYIKNSAPDNQKLFITNDGYTNGEDLNVPKFSK